MSRFTLVVLTLVVLGTAGCGQHRTPAQPAGQPGSADASQPPAGAGTPQPRPGWQIHINQSARFAIWHPPGWTVTEHHGQDRTLELTLTPPRLDDDTVPGGVLVRREFTAPAAQTDLPNSRCQQIRISQLPGTRCLDTLSGSVVAVLAGTGQGTFTFQTSRRSAGYPEFDHIVASFQLLRGA
jgi:hypothetical protein